MSAVLQVQGLTVESRRHTLVSDLSLELAAGEKVALIGESGSGKSLTALSILGLLPSGLTATGSVMLHGRELVGARERVLSSLRGDRISMVFSEPMSALDPTQRVGAQVAEVLRVHRSVTRRGQARARAVDLLDSVRLPDPASIARAYPHQLSGGQRQRVVLAMALANRPSVLVCDEPTTALDVSVQAQVLDLLSATVAADNTALLFITHDLAVVSTLCEKVIVLYGGRVVESGPIEQVFTAPRHPYTAGLLAASDLTASDARGRLVTIPGTVPPAGRFPSGCVFGNRCPRADPTCEQAPPLQTAQDRALACWHPVRAGDLIGQSGVRP